MTWSILGGCLIPGIYLIYKDISEYVLPDIVTYFILLSGLGYGIYQGTIQGIIGGLVCFAILFGVAVISKLLTGFPGIGGGDIKLMTGLGVWFGYNDLIAGSMLVMIVGLSFALIYALLRQKGVISHLINYVKGIAWMLRGVQGQIPATELNEDGQPKKAIPLGAFFVLAAWCVWMGGFL